MKIEHVALWTKNLEELKTFYTSFFAGLSNEKYVNTRKGFESYFITFDSGARLELMRMPSISSHASTTEEPLIGWTHLAFSVGSKEEVDQLTERFRSEGYPVIGEPRFTGDGYYESVVLDPDGNRIEITI